MDKIIKSRTLQSVIDQVLIVLVAAQVIYLLTSVFYNNSDSLIISIPFYSPIGLIIGYGLICLVVYALSYTYEILKFILTSYIIIMTFRLILFYTLGEHYESSSLSITVGTWTNLDSCYLFLAIAFGIILPRINKRHKLSYRRKLYFRLIKFKQHQILNRPI
jgi:hypothetical protein